MPQEIKRKRKPNTSGKNWSTEEIQCLSSLVVSYQQPDYVRKYKSQAKKNGWPKRPDTAIVKKVHRLKLNHLPREDNFTFGELATLLDIPHHRVRNWRNNSDLVTKSIPYPKVQTRGRLIRVANSENPDKFQMATVKKADLRAFFIRHPDKGAAIDEYKLAWLVGDSVAAMVQDHYRANVRRPVKRMVKDNRSFNRYEYFDTITGAAKAVGRSVYSIDRAIEKGIPLDGYIWDESEIDPRTGELYAV